MKREIKVCKNKTLFAVVDKNGFLLHRKGGSVSIFYKKETAEFLAYEWADAKEELEVIKVRVYKK